MKLVLVGDPKQLPELEAGASEGASYWSRYLFEWTRWNHVRGAAALAAATLLTIALTV